MTGEQYSRRHFPRAESCNLNAQALIALFDKDWNNVGEYQSIQMTGFGTVGSISDKPLKAGKYNIYLINYEAGKKVLDVSLNFYWEKTQGTLAGGDQWD